MPGIRLIELQSLILLRRQIRFSRIIPHSKIPNIAPAKQTIIMDLRNILIIQIHILRHNISMESLILMQKASDAAQIVQVGAQMLLREIFLIWLPRRNFLR